MYGPELKAKGMVDISVNGAKSVKEIGEQFEKLLVKDFEWSQQTAIALKALHNNQKLIAK